MLFRRASRVVVWGFQFSTAVRRTLSLHVKSSVFLSALIKWILALSLSAGCSAWCLLEGPHSYVDFRDAEDFSGTTAAKNFALTTHKAATNYMYLGKNACGG